jgi:hypothetical protein
VALAFASRLRALLSAQGDPNVGIYYYIAHQWLRGSLPYVTAWEYKPPGLFALCAAGLLVFRDAALASSMLATLAVIAAALATYAVVAEGGDRDARFVATLAATSVVLLSTENSGILGDAELFENAFLALAFAFALGPKRYAAPCAGLAAGAALQMKLTALPVILAVAATLVRFAGIGLAGNAVYLGMIVLPFALEALLYARAGALSLFLDANAGATLRRAESVRSSANPWQWLTELRLLAPLVELCPFALVRPGRTGAVAILWFLAAVIAIAGAGEFYDRHFVLLVPPIAILGSLGLARIATFARRRYRTWAAAVLILATFFLHDYYETTQGIRVVIHRYVLGQRDWHLGDYTVILAALRDALHGDRSLFLVQVSAEMYEDLDVPPPTRFAFTGNLLEASMWPMLGTSGRAEFARVLATGPQVIAVAPIGAKYDQRSVALLQRTLDRDYRFLREVRTVRIYRREPFVPRSGSTAQGDFSHPPQRK